MKWLTKILEKARVKQHLTNSNSGKTFDEIYNDPGVFEYNSDGFIVVYEDITQRIKWNDITQINVYKIDQFAFDRIDMEIVYGDKCFSISEELPGWYQFVLKTKGIFPSIPKDWDDTIVQPPFATNYTTIFNREMQKFAG